MSDCKFCGTEKKTVKLNGTKVKLCMHTGCLIDRRLKQYRGCSHNLETVGNYLLKCTECDMTATPSYRS